MVEDSTVFNPPSGSLGSSVGRGALVTGGAQVIKLVCQFASVIFLSRLLSPKDFGIMAMAAPIAGFVGLFQDMGLTQATIQKKGITHAEVNALFWVNVAISTLVAGILVLIAPIAARFYGEPVVGMMVAAMSVLALIHALGGQHYAILNRRMQFGRIAFLDSFGAVAAVGTEAAYRHGHKALTLHFLGVGQSKHCRGYERRS